MYNSPTRTFPLGLSRNLLQLKLKLIIHFFCLSCEIKISSFLLILSVGDVNVSESKNTKTVLKMGPNPDDKLSVSDTNFDSNQSTLY